jgi:hypothetical protein
MKASIELNTPFLQQSHQQLTERSFTPDTGVRTGFVVFFSSSVSNKIPQNRSDHVTLKSRHPGRGLKRRPIDKFRLSRRRICIGGGDAIPRFHFPTERVPAFGQKGVDGIIHVQLLSVRIKEKTTISGTFEHILKNVFVKERMNDPP